MAFTRWISDTEEDLGYKDVQTVEVGSYTETYTYYFDNQLAYVGSDIDYGNGATSTSRITTDSDVLTESGSYADASYVQEYEYRYSTVDDSFLGGSSTVNGVTTTYNSDWSIASQTLQTEGLDQLSSEDGVVFDLFGDAFYKSNAAGSSTSYFDADGNRLGSANVDVFSWVDYLGGTVTSTNITYTNADTSWLGSEWSDTNGNEGYNSSEVVADVDVDAVTNGGNDIRVESGSNTWVWYDDSTEQATPVSETNSYTWYYDAGSWTFLGGSETNNQGVTLVYNENWEVISRTANLTDADQLTADDGMAFELFGAAKYTVETKDDGFETTYFNDQGEVIGESESYTNTWYDDWAQETISQTNTHYKDENYQNLGSEWSDSLGNSGSNSRSLETDVNDRDADNDNTDQIWVEKGSSTNVWTNHSNDEVTQTSSFEYWYSYDGSDYLGTFLGGISNEANGETVTYGPNWEVVSRERDTTSLDQLTDTEDLAYTLFDGASQSIYYNTELWGAGGSETTYYNADGEKLGSKNTNVSSFTDYMTQETITSTNINYNDADWNWLGNEFYDTSGNSGSGSLTKVTDVDDLDGDGATDDLIYKEQRENTWIQGGSTNTYSQVYYYEINEFGENGSFLGGTESDSNGIYTNTRTYDSSWTIIEEVRTGGLLDIDFSAVLTGDDQVSFVAASYDLGAGKTFAVLEVETTDVSNPIGEYELLVLLQNGEVTDHYAMPFNVLLTDNRDEGSFYFQEVMVDIVGDSLVQAADPAVAIYEVLTSDLETWISNLNSSASFGFPSASILDFSAADLSDSNTLSEGNVAITLNYLDDDAFGIPVDEINGNGYSLISAVYNLETDLGSLFVTRFDASGSETSQESLLGSDIWDAVGDHANGYIAVRTGTWDDETNTGDVYGYLIEVATGEVDQISQSAIEKIINDEFIGLDLIANFGSNPDTDDMGSGGGAGGNDLQAELTDLVTTGAISEAQSTTITNYADPNSAVLVATTENSNTAGNSASYNGQVLVGSGYDDTFNAGYGLDIMIGGDGDDDFHITSLVGSASSSSLPADLILDFAVGDVIHLPLGLALDADGDSNGLSNNSYYLSQDVSGNTTIVFDGDDTEGVYANLVVIANVDKKELVYSSEGTVTRTESTLSYDLASLVTNNIITQDQSNDIAASADPSSDVLVAQNVGGTVGASDAVNGQVLIGLGGDETLSAGFGLDVMMGGTGSDTFTIKPVTGEPSVSNFPADVILDFGAGDVIELPSGYHFDASNTVDSIADNSFFALDDGFNTTIIYDGNANENELGDPAMVILMGITTDDLSLPQDSNLIQVI